MKLLTLLVWSSYAVSSVTAGITTYTDRSAWEAAAGVLDFEEDFSSYGGISFRTSTRVDIGGNFNLRTFGSRGGSHNNIRNTPIDGLGIYTFSFNNLDGGAVSHLEMGFPTTLTAWGADLYSANTGAGLELNFVLECVSGPMTIPVNQNNGFFGFILDDDELLDIAFEANPRPGFVGELFTMDNVGGVKAVDICKGASCVGDPHFNTWSNSWYDYHGICDLVLLSASDFMGGLGLDIHIRTKPRYEYSFIEAAAIKIGNDILEVGSWGEYFVNGVENGNMPFRMGGKLITVHHEQDNIKKQHIFKIGNDSNKNEAIIIKTHKDLVSVHVANATRVNFLSSTGMMGSYIDGSLLARDGVTIMDNYDVFGQEWQVVPEQDGAFFQVPSPYTQCVPAHSVEQARRRLEEETISEEAAAMACATQEDPMKKEMCIFDVIAMGDLDAAEIHGAY